MAAETDANATLIKFGYPRTVVAEYPSWVVLLRPKQLTCGSLILACREESTAFSAISAAAFAELPRAIADIETNLEREVRFDKINYLMLMMVDPNVHFHVLPRYEGVRACNGIDFPDVAWPGPPNLGATAELSESEISDLIEYFRNGWTKA